MSEKYLQGKGVEFGALSSPLQIKNEKCQVSYIDRYTKEELLCKFPELKDQANAIVHTDITIDLDHGDFSELVDHNFDFFIANHVIEHLVNPIQFLNKLHKVMLADSILYLAVPDKEFTFDKNRKLTDYDHLWNDFVQSEKQLSIEHLNDFILNITKDHIENKRRKNMYFKGDKLPLNPLRKRKVYNLHRNRSIHVHVWNQMTFDHFLTKSIEKLHLSFEIIDSCRSCMNDNKEMIYIIKKQAASLCEKNQTIL